MSLFLGLPDQLLQSSFTTGVTQNVSCRNRNDNACDEKKRCMRHLLFVILSGHRNIVSILVHCESSAVNGCRQKESPKS